LCVDCVLASPRITQVDPGDGPPPEVVLSQSRKFYNAMDKLKKRFLWAGSQELHGGKCKINWLRVCRPLQYGGFGITDLGWFGRAMRLGWLWVSRSSRTSNATRSYQWTMLMRPCLFTAATRVTVLNKHTAKFWTTIWVRGTMLAAMFPTLFEHSRRKNRSVAEAMSGDVWISDLMHDITPDILAGYIML
jgi:hypothetical protein